jgi:perosamine synthetase
MKVPYFVPWINKNDKNFVLRALDQRWLTNGPFLTKFETKISKFIGTKYSVGVGSATHALHLSVKSLGIGPGDEVIVPNFTFAATANAVKYCSAEPILTDVDLSTFNILPSEIQKNISKKTKAIIVVHYGGQSCDMDEINLIAKKNNLHVIEDCAHALGSMYNDKKCGSMGIAGCFSFYPTKIITSGEGGMITTNNSQLSKKFNILKSQGMSISPNNREKTAKWKYDIVDLGYNYRLDEIRSALGYSQASRINQINKMRIKLANQYSKLLNKIKGITVPVIKKDRNHIFHLFTIKIENDYHLTRDELFLKLHKKGIGTSVQYVPLHLMSYYRQISQKTFPNSNKLKNQILCLPIYPNMSLKQLEYVVKQMT